MIQSPTHRRSKLSQNLMRSPVPMEERATQLIQELRNNRTNSNKSPHPSKLFGPNYAEKLRESQEHDEKLLDSGRDELTDFSFEGIQHWNNVHIKENMKENREIQDLDNLNKRLAEYFEICWKREESSADERLLIEEERTPRLAVKLREAVMAHGEEKAYTYHLEQEIEDLKELIL